ncbi:MAG: domain protein DegV family, partial [Oscillospiraceae bacterium]|nr:domain protein DegV family [Oscillospiraceae bacterium]
MGNHIKITADSTCDLSPDLIEKYDIFITPLYIAKDDRTYKDGLEIAPDDIYDYFNRMGKVTKTSAVSVSDYINYFKPFIDEGKTIIHINISDGFSSCYQNACMAA